MNFNTILFLAFLTVCATVYYLLPAETPCGIRAKQFWLLAADLVFYLFGTTAGFVVFLLLDAVVLWLCSRSMVRTPARRRTYLITGVVFSLGVLCFFKYNGYFAPQLADALGRAGFAYTVPSGSTWRILQPLGISYYTFQSLGYLLDVYHGKCDHEPDFFRFLLFVSFFPQLTAGPINRGSDLLPQLRRLPGFSYETVVSGLRRMLLGFFKKIAVADMLVMVLDPIFAAPGDYTGLTLGAVVPLYAMCLYCDFSGYTDIACGCAGIFGLTMAENFNTPFLSESFNDLWKRWHISLSVWLRDHIYIELLGGNRKGKRRKRLNLFLTFALSGLWHGVGSSCLGWGVLHGIYRSFECLLDDLGLLKKHPRGLHRVLRTTWVFLMNAVSLTVLRAASLRDSFIILTKQFRGISLSGFFRQGIELISSGFSAEPLLITVWIVFCVLGLAAVITGDCYQYFVLHGEPLAGWLGRQSTARRWVLYYLLLGFIFAAFLMQNGNYIGSVSFAYSGF